MESKQIEKPWVIYGLSHQVFNIGKVVREDKEENKRICSWVRYSDFEDSVPWDARYLRTFDKSFKAIAYFLVTHTGFRPHYDKESAVKTFLYYFPSEKANLEKFLNNRNFSSDLAARSQSSPNCTLPTPEAIEAEHERWMATSKGEYNGPLNLPK
jgi:hypothetical protein